MDATSRFATFENRNFRLYFIGQTLSSVGSWLQSLAVVWLVLDITNRSDKLGVAMALQFLPMLVLGAPAGVLADKVSNRLLLLGTSAASGLLALTFGVLVATDRITIWWIYALALALGLVLAVERPTMQSILYELVGPDKLPGAVALNTAINPVSRLIGPALAGVLIATMGVAACFFINAASYLLVIAALVALRSRDFVNRPRLGRAKGQLREGFAYVRAHPDVARPLLVMTVMGTVAYNFQTTIPSMVHFEFHQGAGSVGLAMSVSAIGSILGGIYVAGIVPHPRRTLAISLVALAVMLVGFTVAPTFAVFALVSIPLGFASTSFLSIDTVVLQQATEPAMQGRVMALHQMAWFGTTPIGALLMGWVIQVSSARVPFALGSIAAVACAIAVGGAPAVGRGRRRRMPADEGPALSPS